MRCSRHLRLTYSVLTMLLGTLWEGGVRGVGMISGAGLTKKGPGVVLSGFFHAADWMPTILAAAGSKNWLKTATASTNEPPFLLGDGMNL